MAQDGQDGEQDGAYDLTPDDKPALPEGSGISEGVGEGAGSAGGLKPGDPGWIPPTVIVEVEKKSEEASADEVVVDPDVERYKGLAVLAYIFFLIPLIAAPNSKFARYHANQGLLLFIALVIVTFAVAGLFAFGWIAANWLAKIPTLSYFYSCGSNLLQVLLLLGWIVLAIVGIINAANGEKKELPVVGHWTLIK